MPRSLRSAAGAAALCALAIAAPAANADSIAYVKDGNVWLSTSDGARQFQVTFDGGYTDVSQADDGTMISLHGNRLRKLDRMGNVQADFATPVTDDRPAPSKTFYGPFDPAISPDGTKVAYTYYYMTQSQSPTCIPPTCVTTINEGGTGYTHSDRMTGWDEPGFRKHSGWRHPAWVDNASLILSNPTHLPNDDVVVDVPEGTSVGLLRSWFTDAVQGNPALDGGDVSRDQHKLAFQTGENNSTLSVYSLQPGVPTSWRDGEDYPAVDPVVCYRYSDPIGGSFGIPTFAPGGDRMAFAVGDGIHVAQVPDFSGGCTLNGATPTPPLVIPGGTQPDWGPADVPPARQSGGGNAGGNGGSAGQGSKLTVSVSATTLKKALRNGLTVTVRVPGAGKLSATATRNGKTVAKAAKKSVRAGKRSITLKFGKAARRALAHSRSVKLTLKVSYAPKGGSAVTGTKAITLK